MDALEPDLDAFVALARPGRVVPVSREVVADALTPVAAYATVRDRGRAAWLLESVVGGEKWARYSFVGFDPDRLVRGGGDRFSVWTAEGEHEERGVDPWARLREELARHRPPPTPWLPRFWGGAVGYVSYDAVRRFEPTVGGGPPDDELAFAIGGAVLAFDGLRQTVRAVVPAFIDDGTDVRAAYQAAGARVDAALDLVARPVPVSPMALPARDPSRTLPPSSFDRASYEDAVAVAQEHIRAGDIFQVVLSQRFRVPAVGVDLFDVYRAMRVVNPSPYMYHLRMPGVGIAGASPETLVRLEGGVAQVRPIAGTRPRGASEAADAATAEELLADPKERAEHVMLVDLGRNDLGRISAPGTVRVTERMTIERYSHVMHIVSNVEGRLRDGADALDVLRATFPAGTLSGAPKVRAMQIIDALEPERRGIYGGAVGYVGFGADTLDVAIAIRTVVQRGDELWLQAGAGIVEASDAGAEYDETVAKARAGLVAVEAGRAAARTNL